MKAHPTILVIRNPNAGQRHDRKFNSVLEILTESHSDFDVLNTQFVGHGKIFTLEQLNEKQSKKYNFIVAAGGDGTINEVISGLCESSATNQITLGIIPLGTANVLAKEIGIGECPHDIVHCILSGKVKKCYVAKISGSDNSHKYFLLMASVGIDAFVVKNVKLTFKKIIGGLAYLIGFLWEIINFKNVIFDVEINGIKYITSGVIISNGRYYGGKSICAPDANIEDKKLFVVMNKGSGRGGAFRFFSNLIRDNLQNIETVEIIPATKVKLSSNVPAPLQMDGEYYGSLPVTITIMDQPISIMAPHN